MCAECWWIDIIYWSVVMCVLCVSIWRAAMQSGSYRASTVLSTTKRLVTCLVNISVASFWWTDSTAASASSAQKPTYSVLPKSSGSFSSFYESYCFSSLFHAPVTVTLWNIMLYCHVISNAGNGWISYLVILSKFNTTPSVCLCVTNPLLTYRTAMCLKVHNNIYYNNIYYITSTFFLVELKIGM